MSTPAQRLSEARALLRAAAGLSDAQIFGDRERALSRDVWSRLHSIVARRAAGEPLAYIERVRGFHAIELQVNSDVLVPRPETELVVDFVVEHAPSRRFAVLDLGTGSGAIALAIATACAQARVTAVDVSDSALQVARTNAVTLGLAVDFVQSDWLAAVPPGRFDFICCNPPYVASGDPHLEQLRFEPRLALDGGDDGLHEIRRVAAASASWLAVGGRFVLEHGYDQAAQVGEVGIAAGLQVLQVLRDLGGHDRVTVFGARD